MGMPEMSNGVIAENGNVIRYRSSATLPWLKTLEGPSVWDDLGGPESSRAFLEDEPSHEAVLPEASTRELCFLEAHLRQWVKRR